MFPEPIPRLGPEGWLGPEPGPRLGAPLCSVTLVYPYSMHAWPNGPRARRMHGPARKRTLTQRSELNTTGHMVHDI